MASSKLFDDLPEPDYDHLNCAYGKKLDDDDDDDEDLKKGTKQKEAPPQEDYILGTLVVRVVAARGLDAGGFLRAASGKHRSSYNPYASVKFCGQTQRTSAVHDSADPLWPRAEAMYMDVALPISHVTYGRGSDPAMDGEREVEEFNVPPPIVSVALFHSSGDGVSKYPSKKNSFGDSDDPFLGTASLDVSPLLTGKKVTLDKWLPLGGTSNQKGTIRVVCEYESSDPPPRVGDIVRFSRYCKAADLYPVPITLSYKVQEVDRDDIILEYTTQEGWICTFVAHRFMVVCEERHQAVLELCQDEIMSITERLSVSPIVREVQSTVQRVPDEGLLSVSVNVIQGAGSLFNRWFSGGVSTALGDIQYATNWDGRFNVLVDLETDVPPPAASSPSSSTTEAISSYPSVAERLTVEEIALPGMPCCPITGEPMLDPVVAADGHTYERKAILRWFQESDKSPLTGSVMLSKNVVPNYVLLSSLQEAADAARSKRNSIKVETVEETDDDDEEQDDRKMPAM